MLRILIVEDEPPIAEYIADLCHTILDKRPHLLQIRYSLQAAIDHLQEHSVDLCLLDLNLSGKNGYEILTQAIARSFHTIVISAYTDQAVQAFEYGVLDFIPKPFTPKRLQKAFTRYFDRRYRKELATVFLPVREGARIRLLPCERIVYFKSADNYVQAISSDGKRSLIDKPLYRLMQILPAHFIRIHRSYAVDLRRIVSFGHLSGGRYSVQLRDNILLPLGRAYLSDVRSHLGLTE
ncbi:response regulator transcription factor [candidate division KSB1 bacterium]|nr:response regulator transcription factor [candidate division KSB1 bacterium]